MKPTAQEREKLRADVASWLRQWERTGMWHTPISVAQCRTILAMLAEPRERMPHPNDLPMKVCEAMCLTARRFDGLPVDRGRAIYRVAWDAYHTTRTLLDEVREFGT